MRIPLEQIKQARQANLVNYLVTHGVELKRESNQYIVKAHDSIRVKGNMYFQHSTQTGGNAVDYLTKILGLTFEQAIKELTNENLRGEEEEKKFLNPSVRFNWADIETTSDIRRGIAYLVKTRKISYKTIKSLITNGYIYQEVKNHNLLFPIFDDNGVICGAEVEGTQSKTRFKGVKSGSNAMVHGFSVKIDIEKTKYALFFESAIDLLSFIDLSKRSNKPLTGCLLVSMAGLKPDLVKHVRTLTGASTVLCVDNDIAGQKFTQQVKSWCPTVIEKHPNICFKDWNDQLQATRG